MSYLLFNFGEQPTTKQYEKLENILKPLGIKWFCPIHKQDGDHTKIAYLDTDNTLMRINDREAAEDSIQNFGKTIEEIIDVTWLKDL